MTQTRREFLWTAGAAAAGLAWYQAQGVRWSAEEAVEAGWAPGVESRAVSTCLVCPARCGIRGRVVDGRLIGLFGNPLHPMSRGGICPRGIAGVQVLYHPDRLPGPLVREGDRGAGKWRSIPPGEAVALIAQRLQSLRETGHPERLALVAGSGDGAMGDLWRQFLRAYGSPNYVSDASQDGMAAVMRLMHGIDRQPAYDLERSRLVLSFGAPLFEAWWSPLQAFVAVGGAPGNGTERSRPRLVQIDMRFSRTAARAHEWVAVRPGTHAVLALGIAYVLLREESYDAEFVGRHVAGFEDWVDAGGRPREGYRSVVLRHYRPEEVSAVTGVPVERIVALAKAFAEQRPAVAICGADVSLAPDGLLSAMAVHSLNVLAGSVNRPGGVLFGDAAPLTPMAAVRPDRVARAGLARPPAAADGAPLGGGDAARRFAQAVAAGAPVEALLLYYSNPLASSAVPEAWRAALSRIPFIVSFSPFLDETAALADVILPDLLPWERWEDGPTPASDPYPTWGLVRPLVEPATPGLPTGEAVLAVARQLGGDVAKSLPYESVEALLKERARGLFAARRGMTFGGEFERSHLRQMEERGWWLPEYGDFDAFWTALVERGGWTDLFFDDTDPARLAQTPDGRVHLLPATLLGVLGRRARPRSPYVLAPPPEAPPDGDYPLRLIPYRLSTLASGTLSLEPWLAEQPTVFGDRQWVPWVEVHPATAATLGHRDGDTVWVASARGRYRARLKTFPGAAPGTLCAPYGMRHPGGELANPLALLDGTEDDVTGLLSWFTTFVRLETA